MMAPAGRSGPGLFYFDIRKRPWYTNAPFLKCMVAQMLPARNGGMAEWTMATVLKTVVGFAHRGFESLSLRLYISNARTWGGARVVDWGRLLSG